MCKVSVIIPAYNVEEYLRDTVESVLEGSFQDYEILLIDDGSSDGTPEVCRELEAADPRIRAYTKENGGAGSARNYGLDQAEGEYIAFIDGDDRVKENYLERLVTAMEEDHLDWAVCGYEYDRPLDGVEVWPAFYEEVRISGRRQRRALVDAVYRGAEFSGLNSVCMGLYRKCVIDEHHLRISEELRCGEDLMFNVSIAHCIDGFRYLPEPMYIYVFRWESAQGELRLDGRIRERIRMLREMERVRMIWNGPVCEGELVMLYATVQKMFSEYIVAIMDRRQREAAIEEVRDLLGTEPVKALWQQVRWRHAARKKVLRSFAWYFLLKRGMYSVIVRLWVILGGKPWR